MYRGVFPTSSDRFLGATLGPPDLGARLLPSPNAYIYIRTKKNKENIERHKYSYRVEQKVQNGSKSPLLGVQNRPPRTPPGSRPPRTRSGPSLPQPCGGVPRILHGGAPPGGPPGPPPGGSGGSPGPQNRVRRTRPLCIGGCFRPRRTGFWGPL